MAYDEDLVERVRQIVNSTPGIVEKKMFGGVGFLVQGNMACGVHEDFLIVRMSKQDHESAMGQAHVRSFDLTGRAMQGWIMVESEGIVEEDALRQWVHTGIEFVLSLPPK